jgi:hypothetical protein
LSSDAAGVDPPPPGVQNRTYGNTAAGFRELLYDASGGIPGYVFTLPATIAAPGTGVPSPTACASTATQASCTSGTAAITAAAGTYSFNIALDDTGNASTPKGSVSSTAYSFPTPKTIVINSPLALTPPASVATAVTGRRYGTGAGCSGGNCVALDYRLSGGLGNYTCTGSSLKTAQDTFTCALTSPNLLFSSAAIAGTTSPATLTFIGAETGNAATPGNTTTPDASQSLTINPELTVTAPATPPPAAVTGRDYGVSTDLTCYNGTTNVACSPLSYQLSNGLGNYTCTGSSLSDGTDSFSCALSSPNLLFSKTSIAAAAGSPTLSFVGAETGNASTPGNTTPPIISQTLTVHSPLAISSNLTSPFPDAVVHRDYGISGDTCASSLACAPIKFTASGGLPTGIGAYSFPTTTPASFPTGFSCSANSPATVYTCSASPVSLTVTPGPFSPSVTVTDSANSATPTGSKTDTGSLHVDSQIVLGVNLGSTWPDGVTGRGYGTGGLTAAVYTATLGLADGYTFTPTGANPASFPTGFNCSPSSPTLTCTASPISASAGAYTPQVTVTDTANATTPAGTTATDPCSVLPSATCSPATTVSFTVDPEIVIQNAVSLQLPNGQKSQPYSVLFTCQAPLGTGTCGGTGSPNNAAAQYTWSASSNDILGTAFTTTMPVSNPTGDAIFAGTTTTAESSETVTISVADDGSTTTPSCTVAATCPSAAFSANILPSQAYVGATSADQVDLFDTSAGVGSVTLAASIPNTTLTGGTSPDYMASSPNGTYMFIADPGANQVYLHNALTGATKIVSHAVGGLDNAVGDTSAVTAGPQVVPTTGVSPDDVYVYVANAGTDNVQVIDANPASGTFGTVVGTGTFTLGGSYPGAGPVDLKVAPTFFVGGVRKTHEYVLRQGGNEVCIFDVEPSSANLGKEIAAANSPNTDKCISLGAMASFGAPAFIDVSPDGLYAFVTHTNATTLAGLDIIDTNPSSATFETLLTTIDLAALGTPCIGPQGVRVAPDGQTAWVACADTSHQLIPIETALVNTTQFAVGTILTTAHDTDYPNGIAFRPDEAFGLAVLSGSSAVLPFPPATTTPVTTTGLTTPTGIDHIPNAVLHIVTTTLPAATHGEAYSSSIVANGPNKYFAFTDVTTGPNTLANLGFTLASDGQVTSTTATSIVNSPGTYSLTIEVTDQSKPVNNVVVQTVSLTIN